MALLPETALTLSRRAAVAAESSRQAEVDRRIQLKLLHERRKQYQLKMEIRDLVQQSAEERFRRMDNTPGYLSQAIKLMEPSVASDYKWFIKGLHLSPGQLTALVKLLAYRQVNVTMHPRLPDAYAGLVDIPSTISFGGTTVDPQIAREIGPAAVQQMEEYTRALGHVRQANAFIAQQQTGSLALSEQQQEALVRVMESAPVLSLPTLDASNDDVQRYLSETHSATDATVEAATFLTAAQTAALNVFLQSAVHSQELFYQIRERQKALAAGAH